VSIGISATRYGLKTLQHVRLKTEMWEDFCNGHRILNHGDCKGGDEEAHTIWRSFGLEACMRIYPPTDAKHRAFCGVGPMDIMMPERPYILRNHCIVEDSDKMYICPNGMNEVTRGSGTWATFRYAKGRLNRHHGAFKSITLIYPTGEIERWPR
jgi:hypothetical protein